MTQAERDWALIVEELNSERTKAIHKWYSTEGGWCFLTADGGKRFEIRRGVTSFSDFLDAVGEVEKINREYNR